MHKIFVATKTYSAIVYLLTCVLFSEVCKAAVDDEQEHLKISDCNDYAQSAERELQSFLQQGQQSK